VKELLEHVIEEQREFRKETKEELAAIKEKIQAVHEFKISTVAGARATALIVSIVCGFITLLATVITAASVIH
jgi:hypothetical protein